MCGRYFLELKALMELEERIDYTFQAYFKALLFPGIRSLC